MLSFPPVSSIPPSCSIPEPCLSWTIVLCLGHAYVRPVYVGPSCAQVCPLLTCVEMLSCHMTPSASPPFSLCTPLHDTGFGNAGHDDSVCISTSSLRKPRNARERSEGSSTFLTTHPRRYIITPLVLCCHHGVVRCALCVVRCALVLQHQCCRACLTSSQRAWR